jgi:hypothetical protein
VAIIVPGTVKVCRFMGKTDWHRLRTDAQTLCGQDGRNRARSLLYANERDFRQQAKRPPLLDHLCVDCESAARGLST